jgi:hypothetical protein
VESGGTRVTVSALALAVMLTTAPAHERAGEQAPAGPAKDADTTETRARTVRSAEAVARQRRNGGLLLLAASVVPAAHTVWVSLGTESYLDFMLGDDPGPLIDPSPFILQPTALGLAAVGGAVAIANSAREHGVRPRIPWVYWLGLVPAAAALRANYRRGEWGTPERLRDDRLIAYGTVMAIGWFAGVTAWTIAMMPEGNPMSEPGVELSVSPMLGQPRTRGLALTGRF